MLDIPVWGCLSPLKLEGNAQVAVGSRGSVVRAPAAKAGGPGFDSRWLPWVFFLFQLAYTNANG